MRVQLSERLMAIAHCVTKGNRVADIGCDHAHTSMYMLQEGIASSMIAMDVNRGPLEKAKENIEKYGMEGRIELRLSDGAKELHSGEVDAIVISGMGGPLTIRILEDSSEIISEMKELVLQPQSEIPEVRRYLHGRGFGITKECMLWEDGKPYVIITAQPVEDIQEYEKEIFYQYGKCLLEEKNEALHRFLVTQMAKYEKILVGLAEKNSRKPTVEAEDAECVSDAGCVSDAAESHVTESKIRSEERAKEIRKELSYMSEALEYYR